MSTSDELVPFSEATKITRLHSNVYSASLVSGWCTGSVPNGGYVASVMLRAASLHLAERGQPDTISAHLEYVNRTEIGPAILVVDETKIGRNLSTVHVSLYQHDLLTSAPWFTSNSLKEVVGYVINTRLVAEKGLTLSTGWTMAPPIKPADFALLSLDKDPHWVKRAKLNARATSFARAHNNLEHYVPREGTRRGIADLWLRLKSGENFTNTSLGYVADAYPTVVEAWRPKHDKEQTPFRSNEMFWYPTLALNLDVKKALPEEGAEWLFIRSMAKVIRNGRLDLEVIILDQSGDVVALSTHVNMVLSAERNLKERSHVTSKI
ncbi:thioesterase family protein [Colletotrichum tofieldiae]|uniref:Thioesterase family protein n=1 Tax=Colletotrichum tofieldiae TaxID=708197 RepID=A0A166TT53_9PEZI|nr:thioesterase family protein [Colletotrichum tofieldiae]GKT56673.1 thioesterase family protein [Colletotrichum tofieldiae]GKT76360.1 thioesterase family protein [Colletotrichum tofieldiae]GKT87402.1 thioesterase family protein [Colletotrichum tofieldiae]